LQVGVEVVGEIVFKAARSTRDDAALKENEDSRDCGDQHKRAAIPQQLRLRDTRRQIINRVTQNDWTKHPPEVRDEHTQDPNRQYGFVRRDVTPESLAWSHDFF
jgi:hypothetical protein